MLLEFSLVMPLRFQGKLLGLLGNFNGLATDDFRLPNGRDLGSDLTERQIFENFAPACEYCATNSLVQRLNKSVATPKLAFLISALSSYLSNYNFYCK